MGNSDFEPNDNPSPLLAAQQDPAMFQDVMRFGQFTLSENKSHISPGHSPHISPRLMPQQQQSLPPFTSQNNFGLHMNNQFAQQQGMDMYQGQGHEPFPTINQGGDFGQADTMSPPEINIDFAPPSRQASFEPARPETQADALSPPDRCRFIKLSLSIMSNLTIFSPQPQPYACQVGSFQWRKLARLHTGQRALGSQPISFSQRRQGVVVAFSFAVYEVFSPLLNFQHSPPRLHSGLGRPFATHIRRSPG
jgi:hypothetical protein